MKKKVFIITLWLSVFMLNFDVDALTYGGCEYSVISKLKSFVSNVNLSYDYYISNNEAYFNITLSNLVPDIYFVDSTSGKTYNYYDFNDGEITIRDIKSTNGHFKFYSAKSECYGVKLNNKYYNLPTYNTYYTDPLCEENRTYSLCQKWISVNYSYNEFKTLIQKYKEQKNEIDDNVVVDREETILDKIIKFYVKYYYFILPTIIIIGISTIVLIKRKNRFDL